MNLHEHVNENYYCSKTSSNCLPDSLPIGISPEVLVFLLKYFSSEAATLLFIASSYFLLLIGSIIVLFTSTASCDSHEMRPILHLEIEIDVQH